jgi:V/A-type H+-transporting ATPase subunit E
MGLEEILQALEEEGKRDEREIKTRAEAEAKAILKRAEEEARRIEAGLIEEAKRKAEMEKTKLLNAARLYVKKELIKAKEEVLKEAVKEAEKGLVQLKSKSQYKEVLRKLTEEALEGINGKVIVYVAKKDMPLMKKNLQEMQVDAEIRSHLNSLGGVKVETADGSITVSNTLDTRLSQVSQVFRAEVVKLLFGGEG